MNKIIRLRRTCLVSGNLSASSIFLRFEQRPPILCASMNLVFSPTIGHMKGKVDLRFYFRVQLHIF